jgi:ABC-type transport system involved in Fe-S cluster assembly fused permease/ATPase subunit
MLAAIFCNRIELIKCVNPIRYNVRYGRLTASDQEVVEAAQYADIHERIQTFPNSYETQVIYFVIQ